MEHKKMPIIYVCTPYRPTATDPGAAAEELKQNRKRVNQACRLLTIMGYMPLAPHAYFTGFLDEEKEREKGLQLGLEWLSWADELWTFGSHISAGMSAEIARATELGIPVRAMPEPSRLITDFVRAIQNRSPVTGAASAERKQCAGLRLTGISGTVILHSPGSSEKSSI